jgi:hypothetical protein
MIHWIVILPQKILPVEGSELFSTQNNYYISMDTYALAWKCSVLLLRIKTINMWVHERSRLNGSKWKVAFIIDCYSYTYSLRFSVQRKFYAPHFLTLTSLCSKERAWKVCVPRRVHVPRLVFPFFLAFRQKLLNRMVANVPKCNQTIKLFKSWVPWLILDRHFKV